jgi:hypothetical protein
MEHGKLVSAGIGLGAWLIAFALSILGAPRWLGWLSFAAGCGFIITAVLWWFQGRTRDRVSDPMLEQLQQIKRRPPRQWTPTTRPRSLLTESLAIGIAEDVRLGVLPIATELRDIRRKIEKLKSMATPIYWDDFQLPVARWHEYHKQIQARPTLYKKIEHAYVAANDVNEAVKWRRSIATTRNIGVAPSDPLDEAYEAAGEALDALGQPRGDKWETEAQKAAGKMLEDMRNESESE